MLNSGFVSRNLAEAVPMELQNQAKSANVVLSRKRRRIFPEGNQNVNLNSSVNFEISSDVEWVDLKTLCLHGRITIPRIYANGNQLDYPMAVSDMRSIIRGYDLTVKGQALSETTNTGGGLLDTFNFLRSKIYEGETQRLPKGMKQGAWTETHTDATNVNTNSYYYSQSRQNGSNQLEIEFCIPVSDFAMELGMKRSYLPAYLVPMLLRLELNSLDRVFCSLDDSALTNAITAVDNEVKDMYLVGDFMVMDKELDLSLRERVRQGQVSFFYPSAYLQNASTTNGAGNLNFKTNLTASQLQAVYLYLLEYNSKSISSGSTDADHILQAGAQAFNDQTFGGCQYQLFIDSRSTFSQPIDNASEAFDELQKSVMNVNEQYQEDAPNISVRSYLGGISGQFLAVGQKYSDIPCVPLSANLNRVLSSDMVAGVDVSTTGGRLLFELANSQASNKTAHFYAVSTRELAISENFISVIR